MTSVQQNLEIESVEPEALAPSQIEVLTARDAHDFLDECPHATTAILDPWYNRGVGGQEDDDKYHLWLQGILEKCATKADHIFLWGFPEVVCRALTYIPEGFELDSWLTWYYKNCPSRIRGWRSAQNACLHLRKADAKLYHEHFLNDKQKDLAARGKLQWIPGPASVIEAPLPIGFVKRAEQTGHPSQKPIEVIEPLVRMTTQPGDLVIDPFAGSGTTGAACRVGSRDCILGDANPEYIAMIEKRLGIAAKESAELGQPD